MNPQLAEILRKLQDPDAASSLIPLMVILGLLGMVCVYFLVRLVAKLKQIGSHPQAKSDPNPPPAEKLHFYLNTEGKFRRFFNKKFHGQETQPEGQADEINRLRERVIRLEEVNEVEREAHAKSLRRVGELQALLQSLEKQRVTERRQVENESQHKAKLQEKVANLEGQLQETIAEVEKIYNSSLQAIPTSDLIAPRASTEAGSQAAAELLSQQQAEIQKLKEVLGFCKQRMMKMDSGGNDGEK